MPKKLENVVKFEKTKELANKKGKVLDSKAKSKKKVDSKKITTKTVAKNKNENEKKVKNQVVKKAKKAKKAAKKTNKIDETKVDLKEAKKPEFLHEYYDLPYRYNETVVTVLAQTPKRLFVYWDVSDKDKELYRKAFGDDFFEKTYPVLLVHNEELNYTFEVPINDYANCWYLDIQDSKKNYVVQLGRKFRNVDEAKKADKEVVEEEHINLQNDFVYITDSNKMETPNDHILFEFLTNQVKYRNVKTGEEYSRDLKDIVKDLENQYPSDIVHELYTKLYSDELAKEEGFGRKNPGSGEFGLPTSSGAPRSSGTW